MNDHPEIQTTHLTLQQIEDCLIGDLAAAPAAHLNRCSHCAERVQSARSPLESFQLVATAWSERHSATLPIPAAPPRRALWQRYAPWVTACLTLSVGIALNNALSDSPPGYPDQPWRLSSVRYPLPPPAARPPAAGFGLTPAGAPEWTAALQPVADHASAVHRSARHSSARTAVAGLPTSPSAAQIAAEDHMLHAIEAAFSPSSDNPVTLGLVSVSAPEGQAPSSVQD